MKKILLLMLTLLPLAASAYDFEVDGLYYEKTGASEVAVVKGKKAYKGDVVIPAKVNFDGQEYFVKSIGNSAFEFCGRLTSVVIAEGVERIGDNAFVTCADLTTVVLPSTMKEIGEDAFYATSKLSEISLPEGLEHISKGVFHYSSISEITVPSTVTRIDNGFISGHPMISKDVPSVEVTALRVAEGNPCYHSSSDDGAIIETSTGRLVQATGRGSVPEGVLSIGSYAFYNCRELETLILPQTLKELEAYALAGCTGLKTIYCCSEEPSQMSALVFGTPGDLGSQDIAKQCTVYVPKGKKEAYKEAGWTRFNFMEFLEFNPSDIGTITGITVPTAETESSIYNIQGNKMTKSQSDRLPKGVYIQNGRKFVVK